MALRLIRTTDELKHRHNERRLVPVEADEYLRQIECDGCDVEDYREIDQTAKNYLSYMLRNIGRCRWLQVRQAIQQYVAWKWMLGHEDADTFPGANNKPQGHDLRMTYIYLRDQIQSGEWDRLTKLALQQSRGKQNDITDSTQSEQASGNDDSATAERPSADRAVVADAA